MKLWEGRLTQGLDQVAEAFNSSISFDYRLLEQDLRASRVHGQMLARQGIITQEDGTQIDEGLASMEEDLKAGNLPIDWSAEDIHTFIESELTRRIGSAGGRLHTGRSRNDQVATAMKLYVMESCKTLEQALEELILTVCSVAEQHTQTILPGYTHLQRAQPIVFGHHLMAYSQMFLRDKKRIAFCRQLAEEECPLGSGALAGTTYPIDRHWCAQQLGFQSPSGNSMDGVSDRDYVVELLQNLSLVMVHLSRFSEEMILWCSWEFGFVQFHDSFSTGSSIMPQKKNPDIAELVRGKTGRVFGNLQALLVTLKSLPLAYNKDMQEDKEVFFDSLDTVLGCLQVFTPMLASLHVQPDRMLQAAAGGFGNATDCADYLVGKGVAFREAYRITGQLVSHCIQQGAVLETLPLEEYKKASPLFEEDIFTVIALENCVARRTSFGGPARVEEQILLVRQALEERP